MMQVHGGTVEHFLDFSANLNPLGMPESIKQAVIDSVEKWGQYPDPETKQLRQKLSMAEQFPFSQIVCGNGADDLIYRMISALRPQNAMICEPCFGEYKKALQEYECQVNFYQLDPSQNFVLDSSIVSFLHPGIDMLILCTPNNPTGVSVPHSLLEQIAEKCKDFDSYLVIDGCFLDFSNEGSHWLNALVCDKCILLKAFTKNYAMAGLRLGYALCGNEDIAKKIHRAGQYWSVSAPAQAAGIAALNETAYLRNANTLIWTERKFLSDELCALGMKVIPSDSNFLLFQGTEGLADAMLREGILIRDCESFGLHGYYRIAVRKHGENLILLDAMRRVLYGKNCYDSGDDVECR